MHSMARCLTSRVLEFLGALVFLICTPIISTSCSIDHKNVSILVCHPITRVISVLFPMVESTFQKMLFSLRPLFLISHCSFLFHKANPNLSRAIPPLFLLFLPLCHKSLSHNLSLPSFLIHHHLLIQTLKLVTARKSTLLLLFFHSQIQIQLKLYSLKTLTPTIWSLGPKLGT